MPIHKEKSRAEQAEQAGQQAKQERKAAAGNPNATTIKADIYTPEGFQECLDAIGTEYRYNTRGLRIEYRDGGTWELEDDFHGAAVRDAIKAQCQHQVKGKDGTPKMSPVNYSVRGSWQERINSHLHHHRVDPFEDWLDSLAKWDETPLVDALLERCFAIASGQPKTLLRWASRATVLTAVARTRVPALKVDEFPVLLGPRGIGKSTLFKELLPPEFAEVWFVDRLRLSASDKEIAEKVENRVFVEMSELAGVRATDVERLKAVLSATDDGGQRGAWRRNPMPQPRRCAIFGTTNRRDSLPNDSSGNRNFVIVELDPDATKHPGLAAVKRYVAQHRDQIWAEAIHLWDVKRTQPRLPDKMKGIQAAHNEDYRHADVSIEELFADYQASVAPDAELSLVEVAMALGMVDSDHLGKLPNVEQERLTAVMRQAGYEQKRIGKSQKRVWKKQSK